MDQKIAWLFIQAWNSVLSSFSSKKILTADIKDISDGPQPSSILVNIGFAGEIDGQAFLSMDSETGQALASEMLGGMDVSGMGEVVESAVGELCNMIMGNACVGISEEHGNVDITPPSVISYEEAAAIDRAPTFCLDLRVEDLGSVGFDVTIQSA